MLVWSQAELSELKRKVEINNRRGGTGRQRQLKSFDAEIDSLRRQKLDLKRRMRDEALAHREWKAARTMELSQLKRQATRTQFELAKITAKVDKQDSLLRRKRAPGRAQA